MSSKQAGFFHSQYLVLKCVALTALACTKAVLGKGKPLPREIANRIMLTWAEQLMRCLKANITLDNPHDFQFEADKRYVVMINHTSHFDIPITYAAFPKQSIRMLAKKELSKIPLFAQALVKTSTPTVDRHNRNQAIKDLQKMRALMDEGYILWIAPEGTRSLTGKLKNFKKGGFITAIDAEAVIVPLAIQGAHELHRHDNKRITLNKDIKLTIGQPIDAGHYQKDDKDKLKEQVFQQMKDLLAQH